MTRSKGSGPRWCTALILALLAAVPAVADIGVNASLSPQRAEVGEPITLSIDVTGAQDVSPTAVGAIDGFDVRYVGPSTQVTIMNGRMSASVQHRYSLLPQRPGHFTVGPFSVEYQGQHYQTASFAVEVVAAGQPVGTAPQGQAQQSGGTARPLRLSLAVPRTDVYLHERLPVDLTLYIGPVRAGDVQYPTLPGDGLSIDKFAEPSQRQEVIDGQTFQVLHFQTTIIPLRTGPLAAGPATLTLNVFERRRGGFFDDPFFADRHPTTLRSEPVMLNVLPLPDTGKPPSFAGAVGSFTLDVNAAPTQLNAGDPITLTINVNGHGNLADATAPALVTTQGFRTYEAHVAKADGTSKSFEQVLIPNDTTVAAVPPVRFSYFDPDAREYHTLESQPIALVVRPAAQSQRSEIIAGGTAQRSAEPEKLGHDIVYIKDDPGRFLSSAEARTSHLLFWLWQPVPALLFIGAVWFQRRRDRLTGDLRYARFTRAGKHARRGLSTAEQALAQHDRQGFYDVLSRTMQEYLAAKLDLPPGGIDATAAAQRGVAPDNVERIEQFLGTCEHVRFAPATGDGDMRGTLALAHDIVRQLERHRQRESGAMLMSIVAITLTILLNPANAIDDPTAASPQTTFFHANALYKDGQYAGAATEYERLVQTGMTSGNVYFNLGNAYVKAGEKGKAILSYERAGRLIPGDPDLQANLTYARSVTGAEACEIPLWQRLTFPLAHRFALGALAWLASGIYTLLLLVMAAYRLAPRRPRWLAYSAWICAALLGVTAASLVQQAVTEQWQTQGVVVASGDTAARFEPAANGTEHYVLKEGSLVRILDTREGWVQVARCDGRRGWVSQAAVANL